MYLRLDSWQFNNLGDGLILSSILSIFIAIPIFWFMGLYKAMFRYSSISALFSISFSILIYALIYFSIVGLYGVAGIPRSIGLLHL